jgi:hypothetical protein
MRRRITTYHAHITRTPKREDGKSTGSGAGIYTSTVITPSAKYVSSTGTRIKRAALEYNAAHFNHIIRAELKKCDAPTTPLYTTSFLDIDR